MQNFNEFLKNYLTWNQYEKLDEAAELSPKRMTMIKEAPGIMTEEEIKFFSGKLEKTPMELVSEFGCGKDNLTVAQMEALTQD